MAAFNDFYGDRLGLNVSEPQPFKIGVLSDALELSPDTTFPLAIPVVPDPPNNATVQCSASQP